MFLKFSDSFWDHPSCKETILGLAIFLKFEFPALFHCIHLTPKHVRCNFLGARALALGYLTCQEALSWPHSVPNDQIWPVAFWCDLNFPPFSHLCLPHDASLTAPATSKRSPDLAWHAMALDFNSKHYVNPILGRKMTFFDHFLGRPNLCTDKIFLFLNQSHWFYNCALSR